MKPPAEVNLAPPWLPRHQRRYVERMLRRLMRRDTCSVCGNLFRHNSRTTSGLDADGNVVLTGECCTGQVVVTFGQGFYCDRQYDFIQPRSVESDIEPTNEQIADAIAAYQKVIADADKELADIEQRAGGIRPTHVGLRDTPWKDDDRAWFEHNPSRSHRMRAPFPGELDGVEVPADRKAIVFVRQIEPGSRVRMVCDPGIVLLPGSPSDEAFAHAMFEVAVGREAMPPDVEALDTLVKKYAGHGRTDQ